MVVAICGKSVEVSEIALGTVCIRRVLLVLDQQQSETIFVCVCVCPQASKVSLDEGHWYHGGPLRTDSTLRDMKFLYEQKG